MPVRTARATWKGGLKTGTGSFKTESGLTATYNFSSRFGEERASNPEELLAAAEAACYSMALSGALEKNGTAATNISTQAKCTIEKVGEGFGITSISLDVKVAAAGLDDATLRRLADETKKNCPVSKALTGTRIEVIASLGT
jgi:osmotically inducible protein OsmC